MTDCNHCANGNQPFQSDGVFLHVDETHMDENGGGYVKCPKVLRFPAMHVIPCCE